MTGSATLSRTPGAKALLTGDEAMHFLEGEAQKYADAVVQSWPVVTGTSQASFSGSLTVERGGIGVVNVNTGYSLWHIFEYGSVNNPPYRPFAVAAQRVGMKYHPIGRA